MASMALLAFASPTYGQGYIDSQYIADDEAADIFVGIEDCCLLFSEDNYEGRKEEICLDGEQGQHFKDTDFVNEEFTDPF